jgi:hypothetical protein
MGEQMLRFSNQVFNLVCQYPTGIIVYADVPHNGLSTFDVESVLTHMEQQRWITGRYDDTGLRPVWVIRLSNGLRWSRF